jgi:hypothetical protein
MLNNIFFLFHNGENGEPSAMFLSVTEREGTDRGRPPYIREWILRERAKEGV